MATIVLALAAAGLYGLSDFAGGLVSRRASVWGVAVVTQITAAIALGALAILQPSEPTRADLAWGALAGIGTGVGTAFLYRGLSTGRMGVVAPLSAVVGAGLPLVAGVLGGERPGAAGWLALVVALVSFGWWAWQLRQAKEADA